MSSLGLTIYVLVWPVIATGVLIVVSVSLFKDMRAAKREGRKLL